MPLRKRSYVLLLAALIVGLSVLPVLDVYADYTQGEPLWLTLLENSTPIVLLAALLSVTYWLFQHRSRLYLAMILRWAVVGVVGVLFVLSWVLATQAFQQQFKPLVVIAHTAIGGALAGCGIGYTTARLRESRQEIATEKDRWESLFENGPNGVADLRFDDSDSHIERVNERFVDLFGTDATTIEGQPLSAAVNHGNPDIESELAAAVSADETYAAETSSWTGDERLYFKLRVVPYGIGENTRRAFAIYTDVTDLRETEEELGAQMRRLEAANDRLQQFAYIASHDLQEPLRMVSSYMGLLESEYRDQLDDEAQEYIDFAANGANRMQDMIDGLLKYSRVRTQGEEFTETDTTAVLDDTIKDLELRLEESGATVEYGDLPAVEADRSQLGQVFQNLIENAIDHADSPTIRVRSERRDDEVVFSVSDDGPGIPDEQQDRIFDLFKRGERDGDGTGMGLAICDRIVSRHDGDIWVDSAEGDGTTFYVSIPA